MAVYPVYLTEIRVPICIYLLATTISVSGNNCNSTPTRTSGNKKYYYENLGRSWIQAKNTCQGWGMELATFETADEVSKLHQIQQIDSQHLWTALINEGTSYCQGASECSSNFKWQGTNTYLSQSLLQNFGTVRGDGYYYVRIGRNSVDPTLYGASGNEKKSVVCMCATVPTTTTTPAPVLSCPAPASGYTVTSGRYYKLYDDQKYSKMEAHNKCASDGAILPIIENQDDWTAISNEGGGKSWLGLYNDHTSSCDDSACNGVAYWFGGQPFQFEASYMVKVRITSSTSTTCPLISISSTFKIDSRDCDHDSHKQWALCQYSCDMSMTTTTVAPPKTYAVCTPEDDDVLDPDDYIQVGRYYFHKTDDDVEWDEAEDECDSLGLSWINANDPEITEKLIQSEIDNVWINAHSPSGPNDMDECHETGTECANQGVTILGLNDVPISLDLFPEVKVEFKDDPDDAENCFKFKGDKGKGKLESEVCDSSKAAGCYAYCWSINYCSGPNFFAYDDGESCCSENTCGGAALTTSSNCCDGQSVDCTESDGLTLANNCITAEHCLLSNAPSDGVNHINMIASGGLDFAYDPFDNTNNFLHENRIL